MNAGDESLLHRRCRTMQIIAFVMVMGIVTLLVLGAFVTVGDNQGGRQGNLPIISLVAAGYLAIGIPLSFILPRVMAAKAIRQGFATPDFGRSGLLMVWQSTFLISRALLEGVGILGGVAFLVDGHWLGLAVAIVVVTLMLLTFPTQERIKEWVETRERALEEMRLSGR